MTPEKILKSLRATGLSKPEEEMFLITDEPKIPGFLCFPSDYAEKKYYCSDSFGQGFDQNKTIAKIKSIAEFLERLSLYNPDPHFQILKNAQLKPVDPGLFCCYSNKQLDRTDYINQSRNEKYRLTPVTNLSDGDEYLLPAQLVYLSSFFNDEFSIRKERISTGAAFGLVGTGRALSGGLLESIERDACISSYLKKKELPEIVGFDKETKDLVDYLARYELDVRVFDAMSDVAVPTVIAVTLDRTGIGSAVNVGSRSAFSCKDAIKYAILESIHCRRTSRVMKTFQVPTTLPSEDEITSMDNRFYYWHSVDRIVNLDFWLNSSKKIQYHKLQKKKSSLDAVLRTLASKKYDVFLADLTLPEIKRNGFEVKKVIIPQFHPLYLDERAKALYSEHYGILEDDASLKPHPLT